MQQLLENFLTLKYLDRHLISGSVDSDQRVLTRFAQLQPTISLNSPEIGQGQTNLFEIIV